LFVALRILRILKASLVRAWQGMWSMQSLLTIRLVIRWVFSGSDRAFTGKTSWCEDWLLRTCCCGHYQQKRALWVISTFHLFLPDQMTEMLEVLGFIWKAHDCTWYCMCHSGWTVIFAIMCCKNRKNGLDTQDDLEWSDMFTSKAYIVKSHLPKSESEGHVDE